MKNIYHKGIRHIVKSGLGIMSHKLNRYSNCYYHRWFHRTRSFQFRGGKYFYYYHRHNITWTNERCVEIPICQSLALMHRDGLKILEVGNVLSNYFETDYDIVDKYEINDRLINVDVVDFKPTKQYDLIISISTMEHVGWNETPQDPSLSHKDPKKIIEGITNLQTCLSDRGVLVVTVPVGYNHNMDRSLDVGEIPYTVRGCLKRVSKHDWLECSWDECKHSRYDSPFSGANALVVLYIERGETIESVQERLSSQCEDMNKMKFYISEGMKP